MKSHALRRLVGGLRAGDAAYGLWVTLEAPAIADIAAGLGLDWVVIDAARGHLGWDAVLEHVRATNRSDTVALVRVAEARLELIDRALDVGADGIVISRVETAGQLESAVHRARNAHRSGVHGERDAEAGFLVLAMLDTALGLENLHDLLQVDGVDIFLVNASLDASEPEGTAVGEIRRHGKYAGMVASTDEALPQYLDRGFRMLGVGSDGGIILEGMRGAMELVRKADSSAT